MVGFKASVEAIIKHRLANKAITAKHRLSTDFGAVATELKEYTRIRLGIPNEAPAPEGVPGFFPESRNGQGEKAVAAEASVFRKIVRTGTGVSTLADWLGDGGNPVAPELAESRAATCACRSRNEKGECVGCPKHKEGDFLSLFTGPVANLIRRQLEERKQLNLSTTHDGKLNFCDACGCPLKTKVHVPLEYIKKHIRRQEFSQLDPKCWIINEA